MYYLNTVAWNHKFPFDDPIEVRLFVRDWAAVHGVVNRNAISRNVQCEHVANPSACDTTQKNTRR